MFLQTPANELYPAFSPDGRWIAYRSNESGTDEVYVRAFPDKGGKWLISNSGGVMAVWSRNGRELFYRTADQHIMVVAYTAKGDVFVADKPRLWTEKRLADVPLIGRNLDIVPDGPRFVALMPVEAADKERTPRTPRKLHPLEDQARESGAAVENNHTYSPKAAGFFRPFVPGGEGLLRGWHWAHRTNRRGNSGKGYFFRKEGREG